MHAHANDGFVKSSKTRPLRAGPYLLPEVVQRAEEGVLVAKQPDRSVPLAPSPAPVTHLAGGRARARGSPPWHAAYTHACASPMSGGDGLPPSSSGIAGGLSEEASKQYPGEAPYTNRGLRQA